MWQYDVINRASLLPPHGILVSPCFSTHASVHMAAPLESLRISNVAARFNTDGYAKALGARGAAWKSPAVCAPGYVRPARGTLDELLMYDAEPLPCSLVKLPAEVAAKVCLPCALPCIGYPQL